MLVGHVAVSILEHRYLKAELVPVVAAGVLPDVVDKTLCQVLHLTPYGRMYGHTLVGLALSTLVVGLIWGRRFAWSWALGYLGHLLADVGALVPWLYPFVQYDFPEKLSGMWAVLCHGLEDPAAVALEVALCVWAVCAWFWPQVQARLSVESERKPVGGRRSREPSRQL